MTDRSSESLDAVLDQAAQWYARMDCGTGDQDAFEAWRDADPRHAAAFARMLGAAQEVQHFKPALRRTVSYERASQTRGMSRRAWLTGGFAAATVLTFGGGGYLITGAMGRARAMTAVGDQALRPLPDGGQLHINTDTRVEWKFDDDRRDVWLKRGEIALDVPVDPRPFFIHGAGQVFETKAGKFNARLRSGALDILVLKGQAAILRGKGPKAQRVSVGQGQAILAGATEARLRPMTADDIQFVSAWQNGEVFFNGETLGAAVEEYNRYLPYRIAIGDPSLQSIRLGGRFNSRDPERFLSALHSSFAISATRTADGSVVLTK